MTIRDDLENALKESLKSGDETRKTTIRLALAAIKQVEVDKRVKLDDSGIIPVLQKEVKNRRETILDAEKADRPETIIQVEKEIAILETFLPKEMDLDELRTIIKQAINEVGATSLAEMGKVMKIVVPQVQGRASGDTISRTVREFLAQ